MRIKTYFSGTVEAALTLASRELGGDALLLTARPAGESARHLGAYEVVFGLPGPAAGANNLRDFLFDQDCHPALVRRVLESIDGGEASDSEVWSALRDALLFQPWEPPLAYRLALAGPAGSGKSTTALKIALESSQPYRIFDGDGHKVGSPLSRAAALAGVECSSVEPEELAGRVEAADGPLLLDLNGSAGGDWAEACARVADLTTCLVLPATSRTADLMAAIERYRALRPSRLIFTRLDETSRAGGVLSVAAITGLPIFAFGCSARAVGGLEPSSEHRLFELLFPARPARELAAAAGGSR